MLNSRHVALLIFCSLALTGPSFVAAKEYFYERISVTINVNPDSTFDVTERQTFNYRGEFHRATRDIPLDKIGRITDLVVLDGATNQPVPFSTSQSAGELHIEWTYQLADTTHDWVIKYKVHGGLGFFADHDELYWNLFTDYTVPVNYAEALVILPPNNFSVSDLQLTGYGEPVAPTTEIVDNQIDNYFFRLTASNLPPGEKLTIAAGWPLGLIDHGAYWRDWLATNWLYFLALAIVLATLLYTILRWYWLERRPVTARTIVPEYEPPAKLKPAMAELIVKERITDRAWPATMIDLATRGWVRIEEQKLSTGKTVARLIGASFTLFLMLLFLAIFYFIPGGGKGLWFAFFLVPLGLVGWGTWHRLAGLRDYHLIRLSPATDNLEDYERDFLHFIFVGETETSTTALAERARNQSDRSFVYGMQKLRKKLYQEVDLDTQAYHAPLAKKWWQQFIAWFGVIGAFAILFSASVTNRPIESFSVGASIFLSVFWLWSLRYNPRLSAAGVKLKQDWLGFILYLKTAERYRLQNLTPDLFEKFLPYAIIFGVEKQWGRAFASLNLQPPTWYGGGVAGHAGGYSGVGGFSSSAFSTSFASSFASTFASSGGGASGGGGGAGGGGGGGGGGAS